MTMLARSTKLNHPSGSTFETPLLVPSFSSKGFAFKKKTGESEIKKIFSIASEYIETAMLVSAYDLFHAKLEPIQRAITEITIVDSGGYEVSDFHDLSEICLPLVHTLEWSMENLQRFYDNWPDYIPAIFVSFDHPKKRQSLQDQIEAARSLFARYPKQMHTFLIKPEKKDQQKIPINSIIANVNELRSFDIVGFTEKELGSSILDRMVNIAKIKHAMDDGAILMPIHVYGSLDPITSVLYFLSGGEIFDGLTWLRYGYADGLACYYQNYAAKNIGIDRNDDFVKAKTMQENLSYLLKLTHQMRKFLLAWDFNVFKGNAELLRDSFDLLKTKDKRIG